VLPFSLGALETLDTSRTWETEVKHRGGDMLTIEFVMSSSVVRARRGKINGDAPHRRLLMFTFRDISDRKRTEEAQTQAMQAAMAANRAKSEFLANMSHELRTPLNAIIGFSEMIKEQVLGPVGQPRYVEYARDIHDSGAHLRAVVNDILDVSKVEAGKLDLIETTIEIADVIESCRRIVSHRAEKGGLRLVSKIAADIPALRADERLVKQCLVNLLTNAVKFTPAGGTVTLSAAIEADSGLALRVSDTGIGIAAEHIPNLGKPFHQVDGSLARAHDGTGLGLYLVDKFLALHGGRLTLESVLGQGTTATMQFPAHRTIDGGSIPQAAVA
jgi:signal transduction histidine kinase